MSLLPPPELIDPDYVTNVFYGLVENRKPQSVEARRKLKPCPDINDSYYALIRRCLPEGAIHLLREVVSDWEKRGGIKPVISEASLFRIKPPAFSTKVRAFERQISEPVRQFFKNRVIPVQKELLKVWSENKRGVLQIYRAIQVSDLEDIRYEKVGKYWAYNIGSARLLGNDGDPNVGKTVILIGRVNTDDVDWLTSVILSMNYGIANESEFRLKAGAPITITGILDVAKTSRRKDAKKNEVRFVHTGTPYAFRKHVQAFAGVW